MYRPLQPGIDSSQWDNVLYDEQPSESQLAAVHCYWQLLTTHELKTPFYYEVLPDGCVDIVFEAGKASTGIVMTPSKRVEVIDLGTQFHYIGIRLSVGYWTRNPEVLDKQISLSEFASTDKIAVPYQLEVDGSIAMLDTVVAHLQQAGLIRTNSISSQIARSIASIRSVDDMAAISGYSARQLQRIILEETGLSPRGLLSILRFQDVVRHPHDTWRYSDESHVSRDYAAKTNKTRREFRTTFDKSLSEISKTDT